MHLPVQFQYDAESWVLDVRKVEWPVYQKKAKFCLMEVCSDLIA